jgi:uncharacterized protein (TIGR03790 family)
MPKRITLAFFLLYCFNCTLSLANPLSAEQVALVINEVDAQSVAVGKYYKRVRGIPDENIIYVSFFAEGSEISAHEFAPVLRVIAANTLPRIRAYAITWTTPYRVGCMSMTSAVSFGLDERLCASDCSATLISPLYQRANQSTPTASPVIDLDIRPSMMLAGESVKQVHELIDRGVQADGTSPMPANGYLLQTSDQKRNVRAHLYDDMLRKFSDPRLLVHYLETDFLYNKKDIMFYFAGTKSVRYLGRNHFLPGAVADHLTSAGGMLTDSYQMSVLRWLEAGATASYGTVVEPCNHPGKFSNPITLMRETLSGASLLNAYWASVAMPGQGVFVGEPMSAPYANSD